MRSRASLYPNDPQMWPCNGTHGRFPCAQARQKDNLPLQTRRNDLKTAPHKSAIAARTPPARPPTTGMALAPLLSASSSSSESESSVSSGSLLSSEVPEADVSEAEGVPEAADSLQTTSSGTSTPAPEQIAVAKDTAWFLPSSSHLSSRQQAMLSRKSLFSQMHLMSPWLQPAILSPRVAVSMQLFC